MKKLEEITVAPLWYQFYNWKENPFSIKVNIRESAFLPLPDIDRKLFESATTGDIVNVVGSAGTGKTEHAFQIKKILLQKGFATAYIDLSGTVGNIKTFCDQLFDEIPIPIFRRFSRRRSLADIVVKHLQKTGKKRKVILLIDEAQNITDPLLIDMLRRISDQCKGVAIILFSIQELLSIPVFRESIRRRMKTMQMRNPDEKEAEELIRRRFTNVSSGSIYSPFEPGVVELISSRVRAVPGVLLRYCEELCIKNFYGKKQAKITLEDAISLLGEEKRVAPVRKIEEKQLTPIIKLREPPPPLETREKPLPMHAKRVLERLSEQQQKLIFIAKSRSEFTIEDMVSSLGGDAHSISTQMHRISKKLGGGVFLPLRKEGRKIVWKLSDSYKVLFATA